MSTYSNKSKTLPPALSNAGSARGSYKPPPPPKSVRSSHSKKSHSNKPATQSHPPSRMDLLREKSNVHSIDNSIPSPVDEARINDITNSGYHRPQDEPSLRSELLTDVPEEYEHGNDTKLSELRARLEALVTQGTGPNLGSFGIAADHDDMGTLRAPSVAPSADATPRDVHGGPKSIKNYAPSLHQSHYAEIMEEHSPEQPEHVERHTERVEHYPEHSERHIERVDDHPQHFERHVERSDHHPEYHDQNEHSNHPDHVSIHHYHHVHDSPHAATHLPSHPPSLIPSIAQTRAPSRMDSSRGFSAVPSHHHSHAPSQHHSHAPSHHSRAPSHSYTPSHHHHHSHTPSSHRSPSKSDSPSHSHSHDPHDHIIHHDHIVHDHDIPPHMAPYVTQEADRRRESSQLERELLEIVGTAEESENEMRKVISRLQRKLQDTEQTKETDVATVKSLQDALRDAESRGIALTQARKDAEIAAANEARRIEGYRYRDGERHRELSHAGDMIRQLQVDLDDAEEEVLFLRQKAHKADIVEAERRGRNQEREKRRKEKDKERERKALAAANAAVVTNPNGARHHTHTPRHHRTPSIATPSTASPSPRLGTDTHSRSRTNSLYEPRRRPSQRNAYQQAQAHMRHPHHPHPHPHHRHSHSQPYNPHPTPPMTGAGPYGPAGGIYESPPGGELAEQASIRAPSTVADPRLGPYRPPQPDRVEDLYNYYEPPGWPQMGRAPTMTDRASVQPNGSPVEPNHTPLSVVNQPSHLDGEEHPLAPGHSDGNRYRRASGAYTQPTHAASEQIRRSAEPLHTHANRGGGAGPPYHPVVVEPGQGERGETGIQVQNEMGAGSALGLDMERGGIHHHHHHHQPVPGGLSRGPSPLPEISLEPPSLKGTPVPHAPHAHHTHHTHHTHHAPPMDPTGVPLPESVFGGSTGTHHTHGTHGTHHTQPVHHAHHSHHPAHPHPHHTHTQMPTPTGHARNVPLPDSVIGSPVMSGATAYRGMAPVEPMAPIHQAEPSRPPSMSGMSGMPFGGGGSGFSGYPGEVHPLSQAAAGMHVEGAHPPPL
ncbi:hypothetical protein E3P84_01889 [Wallemia ichthyophaga]|nr:hypothetical protein E3P84_01889 [Wallemia ichthyophaga]TIB39595.1 hypothetical protein E3P83_03402 [Wallemia ichthyophaga]